MLPGYFETMGIPLLHGRGIETFDTAEARRVLVINETMARRLFPEEDPLGQLVTIGGERDYEVVGVVGDVRVSGLRFEPRLTMYRSYLQEPTLQLRLAVRTAIEPSLVADGVRRAVWSLDPDIPVAGLLTMDQIIARTVAGDRAVAFAVTLFASTAALLAGLGLYGVLAYYVSRRSHEIGVRMALGARANDVLAQVMKRGLPLVGAGLGLGLLGAFWAGRLVQQLLFETTATDAATFVAVTLLYTLVALIACVIPARQALKMDPARALAAL